MGVNITTIAYLRALVIEIGSTIILMVVEAQGYHRHLKRICPNKSKVLTLDFKKKHVFSIVWSFSVLDSFPWRCFLFNMVSSWELLLLSHWCMGRWELKGCSMPKKQKCWWVWCLMKPWISDCFVLALDYLLVFGSFFGAKKPSIPRPEKRFVDHLVLAKPSPRKVHRSIGPGHWR